MASQWLRQGTRGAALAEQFATATVGMRVEHSRARVGEVTSVGDGEHLVTWEDGSQSKWTARGFSARFAPMGYDATTGRELRANAAAAVAAAAAAPAIANRKRPAAAKGKRPGAPFDLAQLPDDVLDATLHPLGPAQLLVARLACKRWRAAADRLQASVPWMAAHLTLHTLLRQRRPAKAIVERARTCKSWEHETTADEKLGIVGTPLHLALSAPPGALPAEVALALVAAWPGAAAQADPVYGTLPLHTAVANGAPLPLVRALVAACPKVLRKGHGPDVCALPLHLALRHGAPLEVISLLHHAWPEGATRYGMLADPMAHRALPVAVAARYHPSADAAAMLAAAHPPDADGWCFRDLVLAGPPAEAALAARLRRYCATPPAGYASFACHEHPRHGACADCIHPLKTALWGRNYAAAAALLDARPELAQAYKGFDPPPYVCPVNTGRAFALHYCVQEKLPAHVVARVFAAYPAAAWSRNGYGDLPVHVACKVPVDDEVLRVLVRGWPAAVKRRDGEFGLRPLEWCLRGRSTRIADLEGELRDHQAHFDAVRAAYEKQKAEGEDPANPVQPLSWDETEAVEAELRSVIMGMRADQPYSTANGEGEAAFTDGESDGNCDTDEESNFEWRLHMQQERVDPRASHGHGTLTLPPDAVLHAHHGSGVPFNPTVDEEVADSVALSVAGAGSPSHGGAAASSSSAAGAAASTQRAVAAPAAGPRGAREVGAPSWWPAPAGDAAAEADDESEEEEDLDRIRDYADDLTHDGLWCRSDAWVAELIAADMPVTLEGEPIDDHAFSWARAIREPRCVGAVRLLLADVEVGGFGYGRACAAALLKAPDRPTAVRLGDGMHEGAVRFTPAGPAVGIALNDVRKLVRDWEKNPEKAARVPVEGEFVPPDAPCRNVPLGNTPPPYR